MFYKGGQTLSVISKMKRIGKSYWNPADQILPEKNTTVKVSDGGFLVTKAYHDGEYWRDHITSDILQFRIESWYWI